MVLGDESILYSEVSRSGCLLKRLHCSTGEHTNKRHVVPCPYLGGH